MRDPASFRTAGPPVAMRAAMDPALALAFSAPTDLCGRGAPRPRPDRESAATTRLTTLARGCLAAAIALAAACGGSSKRVDRYQVATDLQERCCEKAPDRDDCLRGIVRAPDGDVARDPANQQTFACVQEHFACDETTGRATAASAQAQLDCIQDLPQ
jgi:hypothetical protein